MRNTVDALTSSFGCIRISLSLTTSSPGNQVGRTRARSLSTMLRCHGFLVAKGLTLRFCRLAPRRLARILPIELGFGGTPLSKKAETYYTQTGAYAASFEISQFAAKL